LGVCVEHAETFHASSSVCHVCIRDPVADISPSRRVYLGVLYWCSDSVGIFDFIPPFVHPEEFADRYFVPAWRVYLIWYLLGAGAILSPALMIGALWFKWRKEDEYDT
jgi:hypothetical protein